jgi:DNA helicase HerA-like ATPase
MNNKIGNAGARTITLIVGRTGSGKSTWAKQFAAGQKRLFAFDPFGSFPGVVFVKDDDILAEHDDGAFERGEQFKIGSVDPDTASLLGNLAYLSADCMFLCEEASLVFPKMKPLEKWSRDLVFLGRHRSVSMLVIAQRASTIPIDLRSQAHRVVSFTQTEPDDVKALRPWFGDDAEALIDLPDLVCMDSDGRGWERYAITF